MNRFDKSGIIKMRSVGYNGKMSIADAMGLFQEAVSAHTKLLGLDFMSMRKKYNAKWVISRVRFEIDSLPEIDDEYTVSTWPLKAGTVRFDRSFVLSCKEKSAVRALTEWCVLDADTQSVKRANVVSFPFDNFLEDRVITGKFSGVRCEVSQDDAVYSRTMRVSDLDINEHVNNISYIRLALDCFSSAELESIDIKSFEMYYVMQCFEGQTLTLYKKEIENGYYIEAKKDGKTVFRCTVNL